MTSRSQRRGRRAKKQQARTRLRPAQLDQHLTAQSAGDAIISMYEHFARYALSSNPDEAAAAARADLTQALENIVLHARGHELLRVVQSVRTAMVLDHAAGGAEPAAAVLELLALTLASRDAAGNFAPPPEPDPEYFPPYVLAAARAALSAGSMIPLFESVPTDAFGQVLFHSTQREIMLRNPVYPHMLVDTLRGLFRDPDVDSDCRAVLGFSGIEAVNVLEATRSLSISALQGRFARMEAARDASIPLIESWDQQRRHMEADEEVGSLLTAEHKAAAEELYAALQNITTYVDQSAVIDVQAVSEETGYAPATVEAVLEAFTLKGLTDLNEAAERFFRGDNPLRTTPILVDGQGRRMLVHDALALPAAREVIETRLKAVGRTSAYDEHRGRWVENAALDLLAGVFAGSRVYRAFNYFVPDVNATVAQTQPSQFIKRVEGDGLILVDDVAIIIEVKSVALTAEARGGIARRLKGKLRDIVTAAADQADRLRERIVTDRRIRLDDGDWIDVSGVREIHTIAVGLEDLSGVTTATSMLVAAGVLKPDHIPWTVSLHDLRIICEILDRPSELLLYLRRRTNPDATRKYLAVDELDLYLEFLNRGLYVEPNPHRIAEALPWTGKPTVASVRRYAAQSTEILESRTESLDAWYAAQLDPARPPADKPRLVGDHKLLKLVDDITASQQSGWLSTTTMLLEGSTSDQRIFARQARDLARAVKRDGQDHSATRIMTDTAGNSFVLIWACCGKGAPPDHASRYLQSYLSAKKHQVGALRAAAMLFDSQGTTLLHLLFDNRQSGPDSELDSAASQLVPLDKMMPTVSQPARPSRTRTKRKR
jgi:hypothetical protein